MDQQVGYNIALNKTLKRSWCNARQLVVVKVKPRKGL